LRLAKADRFGKLLAGHPPPGKVRGVRFGTLARMCAVLDCLPGDLLGYEPVEDAAEE
jgi:hypothetical protein